MRLRVLPETQSGSWSIGLAAAFVVVFLLVRILDRFTDLELLQPGPYLGLICAAAGTGALITGLVSIIVSRERSILVFLALAVGLYALLLLISLVWLTFLGGSLFHLSF